jgi:hypothetical protein
MPYGYYQFVRFSAFVGFTYLGYEAYTKEKQNEMFIFGALALLFQPFIKIALGRTLWNIVDVVVALFLILSLLKKHSK